MFVSKTYTLEDCIDNDTLTLDKNKFSITDGTPNIIYDSNGLTLSGTGDNGKYNYFNQLPNEDYSIEFDIIAYSSGYSSCIIIENARTCTSDNGGLYSCQISGGTDYYNVKPIPSTPIHIKQEITGSSTKSIKFYVDSMLKSTNNISQTREFYINSPLTRTITIKNLKIKPL